MSGGATITDRPGECILSSAKATCYSIFGRIVSSEVLLPLPQTPTVHGEPEWDFRLAVLSPPDDLEGEVARLICPDHGETIAARYDDLGCTWLRNPGIGTYQVNAEAERVEVYPEPLADPILVALTLVGQVSVYLHQSRGLPTLHAGAIAARDGAVALLGRSGRGKSTLTASLARRGLPMITDDNLPLQVLGKDVLAGPGLPIMKVLDDTAHATLDVRDDSDCVRSGKKRIVTIDESSYCSAPLPLRRAYLLNRYDPERSGRTDIAITSVAPTEAVAALLAQTAYAGLFRPNEVGRLLPILARLVRQSPLRLLTYPNGFEYSEAVYDRVLEDIERQ